MAKTISTISARLIADASGFKTGFNQAAGHAQAFASQINGIAAKVSGAFAGFFAVSKIKSAITGQMEWIDQLAKQSDQLGIATEQLQGYRHAADLAGIEASQFAMGMKTQQKLVSEAAAGAKAAVETFQALGLSVQQLRGMSAGKQFETIVAALGRVKDQTDRTRLAVEVFGRAGQGFLSLDTAQLQQAASEIERFGGGISRIDAAKVEQANDAITTMRASVSALVTELVVQLSPAITAASEAATGFAAWLGSLDASTVRSTAEIVGFSLAFGAALKVIPLVIGAIRSVIVTLRALATAQAISSAFAGPAGWLKIAAAAGIAAGSVYLIEKQFNGLNASMGRTQATAGAAAGGLATVRGQSDALNASLAQSATASGAAASGLAGVGQQAERTAEQIAALKRIPQIKAAGDAAMAALDAARASGSAEAIGVASAAVAKLNGELRAAKEAAAGSSGAMADGYSRAAQIVRDAAESLRGVSAAGAKPIAAGAVASVEELAAGLLGVGAAASQAAEAARGISAGAAIGPIRLDVDTSAVAAAVRGIPPIRPQVDTSAVVDAVRGIDQIVPTIDTTTVTGSVESLADQIRNSGATAVSTSADISSSFNAAAGGVAAASNRVGYFVDGLESARSTAAFLAGSITASVAGVIRASRELESARMAGDPAAIAAATSALDAMNARLGQAKSAAAASADAIASGFSRSADEVEKATTKITTWADVLKSLQSEAAGLNKQFRSPEQKYADEMLALKTMIQEGMIYGDAARRAGAHYREELGKALGIQEKISREQSKSMAGVGAVQEGTTAAYSAIQASAREYTAQTKVQTQQLKAQEEANKRLGQIVANTKDRLKLDTVSL